jgi:Transposase DNA-binding/KduI/IolB family
MEVPQEEIGSWLERQVAGCQFQDVRHGKIFRTLLGQLSEQIGGSIPFACQDWAATKAAYRFLSNERINAEVEVVRDGDAVLLPEGYHPNVAIPGATLNFVWIVAAHREVLDRKWGNVQVDPRYA